MKNLLYLVMIFMSLNCFGQKLKLQNLKIVDYEIESNDIKIKSYSTLEKNGIFTVYSDSWDGQNYFRYKLTDEDINTINSLAEKNLGSFVAKKELNKNQYFAGNPKFISYKMNGKNTSLCFIEPFMSDEFKTVLKILNSKIYKHDETAKIDMQKTDFDKVKMEIMERSKIDNYLPVKSIIIQN